jgi:polar amino acid transport system substrate-binding protein
MKHRLALILLLPVTVVLLAACRSAPSSEDVHLRAIQEAGVIRIGTSPDFPPYESLDKKGGLVGFDIELMAEVARRLDLKLEWVEMPFKELIPAVKDGKIDAAMAAFVYSAKRDEVVDFTDPYFLLQDAVIGLDPFMDSITKDEDVTAYKAGVVRGSSQDRWLTRTMQAQNTSAKGRIFRYEGAEQAGVALKKEQIDVLLLDSAAAKAMADKETGLKIVYAGVLSNSPLQIIVPEGDAGLQRAINEVVEQLRSEGFIDKLATGYFEG